MREVSRWLPAFVLAALTLLPATTRATALSGAVRDSAGAAIPGATVLPWQAAPLRGVGALCPSCYPDCAKRASTDVYGRFGFAGLDDSLQFRLLVVADGYRPAFVEHVVPADGPVVVRLAPRDLSSVADSLRVSGLVVDTSLQPVARAVVTPVGFRSGRMQGFGPFSSDPFAVTNESGEFRLLVGRPRLPAGASPSLGRPESTVVWYCRVEARGFATRIFEDVPAGGAGTRLELGVGACLAGRVTHAGRGLAGVVLGASQVDRRSSGFVGHTEVATDSTGRFFLPNLLPATRYHLYGSMTSFAATGAAPRTEVTTPANDSTLTVGTLSPGARRRLTGRITYADSTHPAPGTRVLLSSPGAADHAEVRADALGRFSFDSLPADSVDVTPAIRDHHLDPATPGLSPWNLASVRIADRGDVDLELRMLAGPPSPPRVFRSRAPAGTTTRAGPAGK